MSVGVWGFLYFFFISLEYGVVGVKDIGMKSYVSLRASCWTVILAYVFCY